VLGDITVALTNEAPGSAGAIRSRTALTKAIQRERVKEKGHPKAPTKYDDLADVPEKFTKTADQQPFLMVNETLHPGSFLEGMYFQLLI